MPIVVEVTPPEVAVEILDNEGDIEVLALLEETTAEIADTDPVTVEVGTSQVGIQSNTITRIEKGTTDEPLWRNSTTLWIDES